MSESTNRDRLAFVIGVVQTRSFLRALATRRTAGVLTIEVDRPAWAPRSTPEPRSRHGVVAARLVDLTTSDPVPDPSSLRSLAERRPPIEPEGRVAPRPAARRDAPPRSPLPLPVEESAPRHEQAGTPRPRSALPPWPPTAPQTSPAESREETLWQRVEEAPGRVLDHATASALQQAGPGAAPRPTRIRFVVNEAADELARRHRADAVTRDSVVAVRPDRFRPRTPEGLGLLAHESVHVATASSPAAARSAPVIEERAALAREIATVTALAAPATATITPRPASTSVLAPGPTAAHGPAVRTASEDRWERSPHVDVAPASAPTLTPEALRALEDRLMRRLTARIRSDMERGA